MKVLLVVLVQEHWLVKEGKKVLTDKLEILEKMDSVDFLVKPGDACLSVVTCWTKSNNDFTVLKENVEFKVIKVQMDQRNKLDNQV